ncbi:amino acid aminotransferase [Pseudomonas sp. NMI542_15]|uniref:amino acid aminotransferase n=1 Tax=Pseudomonas sp. NMI542_15 TaxID=2903148 RepID=UPI001E61CBB2|nr:amino acid aminotransferase [Pseudomonas sp. NMI542_15]MCE0777591.1 aspartate/tyrosine/aromatic aminotransferase [Pseudomonas sp. NMI542_15]
MLNNVEEYAGDSILSLMEGYKNDSRADKVNLSIGFYYDEDGVVPGLRVIKELIRSSPAYGAEACLYLPMEGDAAFRRGVEGHLFRNVSPELVKRVATVQTVGGSGALRIGADFLKRYFPDSDVWVSDPTWDNHLAIFGGAGFNAHRYPYLNAKRDGVDFASMSAVLRDLPEHSVVLLHACCHNPTGVDLTAGEWGEVFKICKDKKLIPFLDAAYVGFGESVDDDLAGITALAESGITGVVSNSFSKVFSLYGERVGSLSIICEEEGIAARVLGQLQSTIRRSYSTPPRFGSMLVAKVLSDLELRSKWELEVEDMRLRMVKMREALQAELQHLASHHDWGYLTLQKGMFSYTGLTAEAVNQLQNDYAIYMVRSGRMCIAGLNDRNFKLVAAAIASVSARIAAL